MKKFVALITALCMAAVPLSAAADGDPIEESFENSVIYSVYDSEKRAFAPDDFENVKCEKAEIISMEKNDDGTYDYKLLLMVGINMTLYAISTAILMKLLPNFHNIPTSIRCRETFMPTIILRASSVLNSTRMKFLCRSGERPTSFTPLNRKLCPSF